MNNIYEDESSTELIAEMKTQLAGLQEKYQDTDRATY